MTYFWNFGSTLGICLIAQIITGVILTFQYSSHATERFYSVVKIIQEVWSGWALRLIHINGASIFFFFVYIHIARSLYFMRSSHTIVWVRGVTIIVVLIAISFLGYVLPWGQISYWAVAVITNLFSVVPMIGENLVKWIWGGFSVDAPTLTRFYSLHFILPFLLRFLVIIHLTILHKEGSRTNIGINRNIDKLYFHPYFSIKDLIFIIGVVIVSLLVSIIQPYIMGDPVNNIPANPMQTPEHIQPEWYFLTSYAILRTLPRKTSGVLALAGSIAIFYTMVIFKIKFSTKFSYYRQAILWLIISSFLTLIKLGSLPAEEPYIFIGKIVSIIYFSSIIILNI